MSVTSGLQTFTTVSLLYEKVRQAKHFDTETAIDQCDGLTVVQNRHRRTRNNQDPSIHIIPFTSRLVRAFIPQTTRDWNNLESTLRITLILIEFCISYMDEPWT